MRNMRLAKREVTETEALRQILEDCDVVRLGLTDEDGMFIVPVNFGYELSEENGARKLRLYIHSAKEGRKAEAFVRHPVAALEMDCGHEVITGSIPAVIPTLTEALWEPGESVRLPRRRKKIHGLTLLMKHTDPEASVNFLPEMLERVGVYCIDVLEFTGKKREKKK